MPRAGLSTARVVEEAELLADETGSPAVSLVALAGRLGVQVPSLYKHVAGTDDLQRLISVSAKSELADVLGRATVGKARDEAVAALATTYREWATAHPGRYATTLRAPDADDADDIAASARAVRVIFDALAGYGLTGDDAVDATRLLRASLHGFISLDAAGGFGLPEVDRTFGRLVATAQLMLAEWRSVTI